MDAEQAMLAVEGVLQGVTVPGYQVGDPPVGYTLATIGVQRSLGGKSPVAMIYCPIFGFDDAAREIVDLPIRINVLIAVQAAPGHEREAEIMLGRLVRASQLAINDELGQSGEIEVRAAPMAGGRPLLDFDKTYYRAQELELRSLDGD